MKRILAIAFVLISGALLAGCGSSDEGTENLPPPKFTPDSTKPPSTDNPANAETQSAL